MVRHTPRLAQLAELRIDLVTAVREHCALATSSVVGAKEILEDSLDAIDEAALTQLRMLAKAVVSTSSISSSMSAIDASRRLRLRGSLRPRVKAKKNLADSLAELRNQGGRRPDSLARIRNRGGRCPEPDF